MIAAVIPVKSLDTVKHRLAPLLTASQRRMLVEAMLADLLDTCNNTPGIDRIIVVSRDRAVHARAAEHEADGWAEPAGSDLNGAVNWAAERAVAEGADGTLVVTGDCPLATPADLERILAALPARGVVYVPSLDGTGTNAVFRRPGDGPRIAFGSASLARHVEIAREAGVRPMILDCPSIALDIDTQEDLERLARAESRGRSVARVREWMRAAHA